MAAPERPSALSVIRVTHHSIELSWEEALQKANDKGKRGKGGGGKGADKRVSVQLEQKETNGSWTSAYTGFAKGFSVENLNAWESYFFRCRFTADSGASSDWSAELVVTTAKKPLTGEDVHSAILRQNLSELERILETREAPIDATNKFGQSPLMVAAEKGYVDMMDALVDGGADVNFQNDAGKTALMMAAYGGQREAVNQLIRSGASLDLRDRGGSTALHWAADSGQTNLIDWMIDRGADVVAVDVNKWTPLLRVAAVGGNREVAGVLVRRGADINWRDKDGKTALMMAVINGHQGLVELLTEHNADITIKNEYGKTAYEMALAMDKVRIIKVLETFMDKKGIKYYN